MRFAPHRADCLSLSLNLEINRPCAGEKGIIASPAVIVSDEARRSLGTDKGVNLSNRGKPRDVYCPRESISYAGRDAAACNQLEREERAPRKVIPRACVCQLGEDHSRM